MAVGEISCVATSSVFCTSIGVSVTVGGMGVDVAGIGVADGGMGVDEGESGCKVIRGIFIEGITKNIFGVGVAEGRRRGNFGNLKKSAETVLLCREINTIKRVKSRATFLFIYDLFNTNVRGVNT